ncbi:hypothetical protein NLJ89_g5803 [Agrocybe chaxingu]|uniref:Uncharacterized protein n=1 Tax=Agrocybe chaxingu TaxID=84603 RepID=A0A9W8MUP2_9AGAR|nr:hypothetical protein NLJ89_g5803 [Agrocybe chaxingu]
MSSTLTPSYIHSNSSRFGSPLVTGDSSAAINSENRFLSRTTANAIHRPPPHIATDSLQRYHHEKLIPKADASRNCSQPLALL